MTLQWNDRVADIDSAAEAALQSGAELLLDESNRKAPIETGDLTRSGVAVTQGKEAAVGYSSIYAARQHEELGYRHDAGREAKYLENALTNNADAIEAVIGAEFRRKLT